MAAGVLGVVLLAALLTACGRPVVFPSAARGAPLAIPGHLYRPGGYGPFPAIVLLHGCEGVKAQTHRWARWLAGRGFAALIVDSLRARGAPGDCLPEPPADFPSPARLDDALGALRYLQAQPFVVGDRIGAMGWSQGGVFAIGAINGPSLERARRRGVDLPAVGYAAAVAFYPGGCASLTREMVTRPLLVLLAGADDWTVPGPCQTMVENMRRRGADATVVLYPGVYHYFDVEDQPVEVLQHVGNDNRPGGCCGATVGYAAAAAKDAQGRVESFLARHLGGAPR